MLIFLKKHTEAIAWLLIGTGIALVTVFCGLIYANKLGWGQDVFSIERTGQAGSFVGGTAGALWALAGVLFFKSALTLQRDSLNKQIESLDVQREELKLQREELRLQREEMSSTRAIFEQQSFETTFFNLLNMKSKHSQSIIDFAEVYISSLLKSETSEEVLNIIGDKYKVYFFSLYIKTVTSILIEISSLRNNKDKDINKYRYIFTATTGSYETMAILCATVINNDLKRALINSGVKWEHADNDPHSIITKLCSIKSLHPFIQVNSTA